MLHQIKILSAILACLYCFSAFAQTHTISGYITDADTGEALIRANVYEAQSYKGTTTNAYGFYSLTLPAGEVELKSTYVGYQPYRGLLQLSADTTINLGLDIATMDEVVVTAPRTEERLMQNDTRMSTTSLPIQQVESVPALFGEPDLIKAYALTPGVSTGAEGTTGLLVRGGTPDQNLILLDGATVYNVAHLFGFVSVFNTDALKNAELIKGGFPARYGGRLSSVLDISMKEGNTKKTEHKLGIGLLSSRYTINGPINEKTAYLLSGRVNYTGLLLPVITASNNNLAIYNMYDLNAKINHKFNDNNQLYFSLYTGNDYLSVSDYGSEPKEKLRLRWGNITGTMRYNKIFNAKMFGKFMLNYSQYKYFLQNKTIYLNGTDIHESSSFIQDWSIKADIDFLPNPAHYIRFGITGTYHYYRPSFSRYSDEDTEGFETINNFITPAGEFATYIEDDLTIAKWWKLNIGFRGAAFVVENNWYLSPEPRISTRFLMGDWALKGAYSYMQQYIHLLSDSNGSLGLPGSDIWVPSTKNVPPQRSWQVATGVSRTFPKQHLDISIEGYYKKMNNIIDFQTGAGTFFGVDKTWEELVETGGKGEAYGLEFFVHRKQGRLNGWIGYTLSWNQRQFENINNGITYPAAYDRRHDAALVLSYHLSKKTSFSLSWTYATGSPTTLPVASYYDYTSEYGTLFPSEYHGSRNNYLMPAQHRLDLNFSLKKTTKKGRITHWNFGLYNAYNRANPLYMKILTYPTYNNGEIAGQQKILRLYGLLPVLPSVSYNIKF